MTAPYISGIIKMSYPSKMHIMSTPAQNQFSLTTPAATDGAHWGFAPHGHYGYDPFARVAIEIAC